MQHVDPVFDLREVDISNRLVARNAGTLHYLGRVEYDATNNANFAEGFRKRGRADKLRLYNIAQGSLEESRYYFILAKDLGYGDSQLLLEEVDEVGRMLDAYMRAVGATVY